MALTPPSGLSLRPPLVAASTAFEPVIPTPHHSPRGRQQQLQQTSIVSSQAPLAPQSQFTTHYSPLYYSSPAHPSPAVQRDQAAVDHRPSADDLARYIRQSPTATTQQQQQPIGSHDVMKPSCEFQEDAEFVGARTMNSYLGDNDHGVMQQEGRHGSEHGEQTIMPQPTPPQVSPGQRMIFHIVGGPVDSVDVSPSRQAALDEYTKGWVTQFLDGGSANPSPHTRGSDGSSAPPRHRASPTYHRSSASPDRHNTPDRLRGANHATVEVRVKSPPRNTQRATTTGARQQQQRYGGPSPHRRGSPPGRIQQQFNGQYYARHAYYKDDEEEDSALRRGIVVAGSGRGNSRGSPYRHFERQTGNRQAIGRSPSPYQAAGGSSPLRTQDGSFYKNMVDSDRGVLKRCVRCVVYSGYIPPPEFKLRIGFHLADARRMYEAMCESGDLWARGNPLLTTPMQVLVHNCANEILKGVCEEWSRWFGPISRRRVEEAFMRLARHSTAIGMMLDRNSRGMLVQLPVTRPRWRDVPHD